MDIQSLDSLDEFSPELYVAILSEVAHSDGLDAQEQAILAQYAVRFEVDLDALPSVPAELSGARLRTPWRLEPIPPSGRACRTSTDSAIGDQQQRNALIHQFRNRFLETTLMCAERTCAITGQPKRTIFFETDVTLMQ